MSSKISYVDRKSMQIRYSGRSSDYITPSFGFGCLFKCAYCYMRRHKPNGLDIAKNTFNILKSLDKHIASLGEKTDVPNQTSAKYWTYDISCNEDFALHAKYHDWISIFNYFVNQRKAMATFATKYVNDNLLDYNPKRKIRIRFSVMPQQLSSILEPNTSLIINRIMAVDRFIEAGYDVHFNFSPIIFSSETIELYADLFKLIDKYVNNKEIVLSEAIMLTHSHKMHAYNLEHAPEAEKILWQPDVQEDKITTYGTPAIRYQRELKQEYVEQFKELHQHIIPWNTIRYIF